MRIVSWVMVLAIAAGAAAAAADERVVWREITGPPELSFPRDHGAHPDTRTEWWYVTGRVTAADGRRYGFQVTFFRQGLAAGDPEPGASTLRARQIAAAHLAVADIDAGEFHHAERLRRSGGGLAGWSTDDLDVWLEDWEMRRDAAGRIRIIAHDQKIGLELELDPEKPLVFQGDRGYSQKGPSPGNASAYLTWTRIAVSGQIVVDGLETEVTGAAWFDHEWGSSQLGDGVFGWDWFSLRLSDGRDLMVYQLRRDDGSSDPFSSGSVVATDGSSSHLLHHDFDIEPVRWWTSLDTGGRYPTGWRVSVPAHGIELVVTGLLPGAELDGRATTGVVYWEGPVDAEGSQRGEGYVELTGYAGSLEGRF
ncbi:MAG: lipocalin-like domain-containing protein [Thermoanaerobaculales bacterium]|jgi:predicted secreted hydrolase|nr:lipocalin-like domain-containing protein [Thermoanaerobaculales bacterium]